VKPLNKIRIGGGEWRSRLLRFPDALGLRPTPDRVRETLFNWLGQELYGQHCLDLFAGSGALGFEAHSRGAASVTLVEQNPAVHRALQENAKQLNAERARVLRMDALQYLAGETQRFDVIFLDPPFGQSWLEKLLPRMVDRLAPEGRLYVEAESPLSEMAGWQVLKHGKAGNVFYHLLKFADEK
jgi:16S rRNA (guanine(966)-N(2))-methyltransferase RsmD